MTRSLLSLVALLVACARPVAPPRPDPQPTLARSQPQTLAQSSPDAAALDVASMQPRSCDMVTDTRPPPQGAQVTSVSLQAMLSATPVLTLAAFRAMLDASTPLDRDDPSVCVWSYSPAYSGTFAVGARSFRIQAFLGNRAVLTWPDGARTMIDGPSARQWASATLVASLQRNRGGDVRCRDAARRYFYRFANEPSAHRAADLALLRERCDRVGDDDDENLTQWCCP